MKHKYSIFSFAIFFAFLAVIVMALFYLFPDYIEKMSTGKRRLDAFLMIIPAGFTMVYMVDSWGKSVETLGEYVKFTNFKFHTFGSMKSFSVTVSYESILRLEVKKLPLIGIYKVLVTSENYTNTIPISMCFVKYKRLFSTLCSNVRRFNKDALIDDELIRFTEEYTAKHG